MAFELQWGSGTLARSLAVQYVTGQGGHAVLGGAKCGVSAVLSTAFMLNNTAAPTAVYVGWPAMHVATRWPLQLPRS